MAFNNLHKSKRNYPQNNMNVLSDEEDSSIPSTISSHKTSFSPDIIIHKQPNISCLANSMSIESDSNSDSDFDPTPRITNRLKVIINSPKHNKPRSVRSSSSLSRTSLKTNKIKSQQCQTENMNVSAQKDNKIKIISNKKVNINLNSIIKNKAEENNKVLDIRKAKISKNLFGSTPSSSRVKIYKEIAIQVDNEKHITADNSEIVSNYFNIRSRSEQIQTEDVSRNQNSNIENSSSNNYLKRPHNVSTQTDSILEVSSDENNTQNKEPLNNNTIQMKVTPPKRLKAICEEPVARLIEEQRDKLEAVKVNMSKLFENTYSKKNPKKIDNFKPIATSTAVKNAKTTPMKQMTLMQLQFCKSKNTQSEYSTPCSTPTKSTSSMSSIKSKIKDKTPEKKNESKYSEENHKRVYENVKKIVEWVLENNNFSILFTKSETDLLSKLFNFPDMRITVICIRLYTRQHKWYNFLNFCEELNLTYNGFNLQEFYSYLNSGFITSDYSGEKIETLLDYLTQPNIKDICHDFKITGSSRKNDMKNKLLEYSKRQCTLTSLKRADQVLRDKIEKKLGICVKLDMNFKNILDRIHILYSFTNSDLEGPNDLYSLMNKIRHEHLKLSKAQIDTPLLFSDRQDFLKFFEAYILKKEFYEQIAVKDINSEYLLCVEAFERLKKLFSSKSQIKFDQAKPLFLRRFTAPWIYCKVLTVASQNLGKAHPDKVCEWLREMLKQEIYCPYSRGYWYSQLALVTKAHMKNIIGEVEIIIDGLCDKYVNEVQKCDLSIRGSKIRLGKLSQLLYDQLQCVLLPKIEIPVSRTIQANVVHNNEPGKKLKFIRITSEGKEYSSVEETAINYYTTEDNYTHGIHCEGQLLNALFIILFYDIIFMHVKNTFITEIQDKPLDLYSKEFYINRQDKINERLKNIGENFTIDEICNFALEIYNNYSAELKTLISFDFVQEETFQIIINCIGQKVLAAIMERLVKDYKQFHSGLPDLFLWNHRQYTSCFVEVKSENDKLSAKQILWINYLHKIGATVEVCHVLHIGSRSVRKVKH